jgi:hypothetical protein
MKDKIVAVIGWVAWIALPLIILYILIISDIGFLLILFPLAFGAGRGFLLITVIIAIIICGSIGHGVCKRDGFAKGAVFVLILVIGMYLYLAYSAENSKKRGNKGVSVIYVFEERIT